MILLAYFTSDCVVTKNQLNFCCPNGAPATPEAPLVVCKAVKQRAFSTGQLILRGGQEKGTQYAKNDTIVST